jgi:hypothetical protein
LAFEICRFLEVGGQAGTIIALVAPGHSLDSQSRGKTARDEPRTFTSARMRTRYGVAPGDRKRNFSANRAARNRHGMCFTERRFAGSCEPEVPMPFFASVVCCLSLATEPVAISRASLAEYPVRIALVNGGQLVDRWLESESYRALVSHPAWQAKMRERETKQGLGALRFLAGALQTDLPGMTRELFARTVAVYADPETKIGDAPLLLACVDFGSEENAAKWIEVLDQTLALIAPSDDGINDGEIRSANGHEFHATAGRWMVVGNERAAVEAARAALATETPPLDAAGPPRLAFDVAVDRLREQPESTAPARQENGLGALVAFGLDAAGRLANRLDGAIEFGADAIRGSATLHHESLDAELLDWYVAPSGAVPPDIELAGAIASLRMDRAFAEFYRKRDTWLEEASENAFVQFDNGMGLFFGGRSFGDEILPALSQGALLLVNAQDYSHLPVRPQVAFPTFTLVTRVATDTIDADDLGTAFQSALAIVNLDRAGKGGDSLRSGIEELPTGTLYSGRFVPRKDHDGEPLDLRFNFSPALTVAADHLVISSTAAGAKQTAAALGAQTAPRAARPALTELRVALPALGDVLGANRETLITDRMLKEGETRAEAESAIDLFVEFLARCGELRLDLGLTDAGHELRFSLGLAPGVQR